jgi:hypothetical protein
MAWNGCNSCESKLEIYKATYEASSSFFDPVQCISYPLAIKRCIIVVITNAMSPRTRAMPVTTLPATSLHAVFSVDNSNLSSLWNIEIHHTPDNARCVASRPLRRSPDLVSQSYSLISAHKAETPACTIKRLNPVSPFSPSILTQPIQNSTAGNSAELGFISLLALSFLELFSSYSFNYALFQPLLQ